MLLTLLVASAINHISVGWGHLVFIRDSPVGIKTPIQFTLKEVDVFIYDRYLNEDILSFNFDMKADLTPLMTWNTHTIFASLVCEFKTSLTELNTVTVWD